MTVVMILETLLIGPLKLFFEIVYALANRFVQNPGISIIVLSLVMNFLVLPLYKRADAMQEEARDIEAKLHDGVAHIKKTFSGDERMMILQEYYRQNHYKPTDALNGSVSLLLEVPFFMAAYQFLSNLQLLQGASLGPIADLGAPDGMIVLAGVSINVLPILMTLINVISSAIYLKGFPLKTKIQLYAMAGFFLVFLYSSPSGLVFYWTLNNLFSLVKTIFYKLKNPRKVLSVMASLAGIAAWGAALVLFTGRSMKLRLLLAAMGAALQLPMAWSLFGTKLQACFSRKELQPSRKIFLLGAVFLTILVGLLIPSTLIADSPQEFFSTLNRIHPLRYVFLTFCMAAGTFLVWMNVFYWLASPRGKAVFDRIVWILCGIMLVNYMFFGTDLGVISSTLQYENGIQFTSGEKLMNIAVLLAVSAALYLVVEKWNQKASAILLTAILAIGSMSAVNMVQIQNSVNSVFIQDSGAEKSTLFKLSKTGKNVMVIMLDRAMGEYVPYIFHEKPELAEQFSGFTYYGNVVSFGGFTNWGAAPIFGGYEYTPVEMNRRDDMLMADKHNEALKVMPVLFSENGYSVTVCDPVYANYQWIPDLSIFHDYPDISANHMKGYFGDTDSQEAYLKSGVELKKRNLFCFGVMKTMPLFLQGTLYNSGLYNRLETANETAESAETSQLMESVSKSTGFDGAFMESYYVLDSLASITEITDTQENTALFMCNDATHDNMLLQEPEYVPAMTVDNTEYDAANMDRFLVDGKQLKVETTLQMSHYHINMATFLKLGEWFDFLKENGVYDNTRIILVSDHGRGLEQIEDLMICDDMGNLVDVEWYYPLLMVKDFGSTKFSTSDDFMTNADVPALATAGIIENPVNPFTGKLISSDEKFAHPQFISLSDNSSVPWERNTFPEAKWASVRDNIWDSENWTFYSEEVVLKEHAMP